MSSSSKTSSSAAATASDSDVRTACLEAVAPKKASIMKNLDEKTALHVSGVLLPQPAFFLYDTVKSVASLWGGQKESLFPAKAFLEHLPEFGQVSVGALQQVANTLSAPPGRFDTFEITDVEGHTHLISSRVLEFVAASGRVSSSHLGQGVIQPEQLPDKFIIGGAGASAFNGENVLFFSAADRPGVGGRKAEDKLKWKPLLDAADLSEDQRKTFYKNPSAFWAQGAKNMKRESIAFATLEKMMQKKVEDKLGNDPAFVSRATNAFLNWNQHVEIPCVGDSFSEGGNITSEQLNEMAARLSVDRTSLLCELARAMLDQETITSRVSKCVLLPAGTDRTSGLPRFTVLIEQECDDVARLRHLLAARKYYVAEHFGLFHHAADQVSGQKRSHPSASEEAGQKKAKSLVHHFVDDNMDNLTEAQKKIPDAVVHHTPTHPKVDVVDEHGDIVLKEDGKPKKRFLNTEETFKRDKPDGFLFNGDAVRSVEEKLNDQACLWLDADKCFDGVGSLSRKKEFTLKEIEAFYEETQGVPKDGEIYAEHRRRMIAFLQTCFEKRAVVVVWTANNECNTIRRFQYWKIPPSLLNRCGLVCGRVGDVDTPKQELMAPYIAEGMPTIGALALLSKW